MILSDTYMLHLALLPWTHMCPINKFQINDEVCTILNIKRSVASSYHPLNEWFGWEDEPDSVSAAGQTG